MDRLIEGRMRDETEVNVELDVKDAAFLEAIGQVRGCNVSSLLGRGAESFRKASTC